MMFAVVFLFSACPAAYAQEGAFHAALRHLVAIPYALLGGMLGPGCRPVDTTGDFVCDSQESNNRCVATFTGANPYREVAPAVVMDSRRPEYITYSLIREAPVKQDEDNPPVTYDSPLPFPDLDR